MCVLSTFPICKPIIHLFACRYKYQILLPLVPLWALDFPCSGVDELNLNAVIHKNRNVGQSIDCQLALYSINLCCTKFLPCFDFIFVCFSWFVFIFAFGFFFNYYFCLFICLFFVIFLFVFCFLTIIKLTLTHFLCL